jgi:hypothetical protein
LLQIYLLLPCSIAKISCQKSTDATSVTELFTGSLQIYSIVSSVISLGWSFSTYEANQKKGALDFSSDPMGRIVILISALMQVSIIVEYNHESFFQIHFFRCLLRMFSLNFFFKCFFPYSFTDYWKNSSDDLHDLLLWQRSILATYVIDWNSHDGHSNRLHHKQSSSYWTRIECSISPL